MISDPVGDMLTRIRNSLMVGKASVSLPHSIIKESIAGILLQEGYISGVKVLPAESGIPQPVLQLTLKYVGRHRERRPVITGLKRISRPGRRIYAKQSEIPWVQSGMGVAILSTPKGVVSGQTARKLGVGGEVLCHVW